MFKAIVAFIGFNVYFISGFAQNGFKDGSLDRGDFTLHYKIHGNRGDYVLLLSGGPGSAVTYMQPFADSLSRNFQCIMLEQRGTGRSLLKKYDSCNVRMNLYVEDIEALRKQLNAERFILLGTSWGALLALLYASEHPSRVSQMIIVG